MRSAEGDARLASDEDAPVVAHLFAEFRDLLGGSSPSVTVIERGVRRVMKTGDGEFLLAFADDGGPVGFAQLRYRWSVWTDSPDGWLEDLFVSERHRRHGHGRGLLGEVISRARARGCGRLELDVLDANEEAIGLYRSLGFSDTPKGPGTSRLMGLRL